MTEASGPAEVRSTLTTSLPSLAGMSAGSEFEFVLRGNFTTPVFQGSARVLYDSTQVVPVAAARGQLIPGGAVLVAPVTARPGTLQLSSIDRPAGFDAAVPFAFTGRPGSAPIGVGGGELLRVRFRVKRANPTGTPVRLQNDPQFLQLRDSSGQRVAFDLTREAATR